MKNVAIFFAIVLLPVVADAYNIAVMSLDRDNAYLTNCNLSGLWTTNFSAGGYGVRAIYIDPTGTCTGTVTQFGYANAQDWEIVESMNSTEQTIWFNTAYGNLVDEFGLDGQIIYESSAGLASQGERDNWTCTVDHEAINHCADTGSAQVECGNPPFNHYYHNFQLGLLSGIEEPTNFQFPAFFLSIDHAKAIFRALYYSGTHLCGWGAQAFTCGNKDGYALVLEPGCLDEGNCPKYMTQPSTYPWPVFYVAVINATAQTLVSNLASQTVPIDSGSYDNYWVGAGYKGIHHTSSGSGRYVIPFSSNGTVQPGIWPDS